MISIFTQQCYCLEILYFTVFLIFRQALACQKFWVYFFFLNERITNRCLVWLHVYILWKLENWIADIQTTLIHISREPNLLSLRSWFLVFTGLKTISVTQYKNRLGSFNSMLLLNIITFYKHLRHYWCDSSLSCIQLCFQFQLTVP